MDSDNKPSRKRPVKKRPKNPSNNKKPLNAPPPSESTRLNRYIAQSGICSRREADALIKSGKIKVNNKVVTEMGHQVLRGDKVHYGSELLSREKLVYLLLNKPKDFITTTDDPQERRTVMKLIANACEERIYPVGRLDRNTTGVLLFTNDGDLSKKLTHPSHEVNKVYHVELDKPIENDHFEKIKDGIELEDGPIKVDDIAILNKEGKDLGVEIHSGKNRIVRRIFESFGYTVTRLDRVMFAGLTKKDLPRGTWRMLKDKEIIRLKHLK